MSLNSEHLIYTIRCGIASSILCAIADHVALENYKLTETKEGNNLQYVMLDLDVDRSNEKARSLYIKNGYIPKFSWRNLANHRQRMSREIQVRPARSEVPQSIEYRTSAIKLAI
jgi:hypothetical protein